ncbi:MAG: hypothetical protein IPP45_18985 [Sphingomonadales bacterium]|nr:hypothetical protein [Sphingomonadales bacterium]
MAADHYQPFIEEAFVTPIRSVLIVDDDYPTFDELLGDAANSGNGHSVGNNKAWHQNPTRIKGVIDSFRTPQQPLLVDIHDGTNVKVGDDVTVASHLHQSDLLVLDYQLDKAKPNDGSLAIEIIRSLMSNDHFNLVIVHTNDPLDGVFQSILIGLLSPEENALSDEQKAEATNLIESAEDNSEGLGNRLLASISTDQYLHSRLETKSFQATMMKGQQPYSNFKAECDTAGWNGNQAKLVLGYYLDQVRRTLISQMQSQSSQSLKWSRGATKWIVSDSVFVAFSNKGDHDDLMGDIKCALGDWNPQPSRLFLTKLRAEMDEYGVKAQSHALDDIHALAHWYESLLGAGSDELRSTISESVSRHSDQLLRHILPRVQDFAARLVTAEAAQGNHKEICKGHFKVDLAKAAEQAKAEREHNAFVCSKPREGWHLTTGHVFKMDDDLWVCLSPACDMVPSQLSDAKKAAYGERLPFVAIKLRPSETPPDIQSNRYVFLKIEGSVRSFCFNEPSEGSSAPIWRTFFAEGRGKFDSQWCFKAVTTEKGKTKLVSKQRSASVVGQLRYEYALNLMQRLGGSLTRIGLDFVG